MKCVHVYDITKPFVAPVELNILLQDKALADILHVVEVKDNEIVLQYENGLLKQVLTAGRYTFWKSVCSMNSFVLISARSRSLRTLTVLLC